jgi:hypothetical protein
VSLLTEWQVRIPAPRQVSLTNSDLTSVGGGVNMTVLNAAVADTKSEFKTITGQALDDVTPNPDHIAAGIMGVTCFLTSYGAAGPDYVEKILAPFKTRCARLAVLLSRSTSKLTPSDPDTSGGLVRPDFDPDVMGGLVPNQPGGGRPSPFPRFN